MSGTQGCGCPPYRSCTGSAGHSGGWDGALLRRRAFEEISVSESPITGPDLAVAHIEVKTPNHQLMRVMSAVGAAWHWDSPPTRMGPAPPRKLLLSGHPSQRAPQHSAAEPGAAWSPAPELRALRPGPVTLCIRFSIQSGMLAYSRAVSLSRTDWGLSAWPATQGKTRPSQSRQACTSTAVPTRNGWPPSTATPSASSQCGSDSEDRRNESPPCRHAAAPCCHAGAAEAPAAAAALTDLWRQ